MAGCGPAAVMTKHKSEEDAGSATFKQNSFEKRICNCICGLQLVSILSGVSLLYLSVIVVMPSKRTLDAQFNETEFVCTTLSNKSTKACDWLSCGEWCLSKGGSCLQIHAKVRWHGSDVELEGCEEINARFCSAQTSEQAQQFTCSHGDEYVGECNSLDGFMSCIQVENTAEDIKSANTSRCRNITAISDCSGTRSSSISASGNSALHRQKSPVACSRFTCNDLEGTYDCKLGNCRKLENPQCQERCSGLEMKNVAVVVPDHFHWARCQRAIVNGTQIWSSDDDPLLMYCTYLTNVSDSYMRALDCFNGTQVAHAEFERVTSYRQVLQLLSAANRRPLSPDGAFLDDELNIQVYNNTRVMINIDGCVNTLSKECTRWLNEKGRDGSDGMHPSIYSCLLTPTDSSYVITDYNGVSTRNQLLLAVIVPLVLLISSCSLLCLCARLVGVTQYGEFFCKCCHKPALDTDSTD